RPRSDHATEEWTGELRGDVARRRAAEGPLRETAPRVPVTEDVIGVHADVSRSHHVDTRRLQPAHLPNAHQRQVCGFGRSRHPPRRGTWTGVRPRMRADWAIRRRRPWPPQPWITTWHYRGQRDRQAHAPKPCADK